MMPTTNILGVSVYGEGTCYLSSLFPLDNGSPTFDRIDLPKGTNPVLFLELFLTIYADNGEGIKFLRKNIVGTEKIVLTAINKEIEILCD